MFIENPVTPTLFIKNTFLFPLLPLHRGFSPSPLQRRRFENQPEAHAFLEAFMITLLPEIFPFLSYLLHYIPSPLHSTSRSLRSVLFSWP